MMSALVQRILNSPRVQAWTAGLCVVLLSACQARGNPDKVVWAHAERFSDPIGITRAAIQSVEYQKTDEGGVLHGRVTGHSVHLVWNRYICEHVWIVKNALSGKESSTSRVYDVYDSEEGMRRFPGRVTESTSRFWEGSPTDPLMPRLGEQEVAIDGVEVTTLPFVHSVGEVNQAFQVLGAKDTPLLRVKATFTDLPEDVLAAHRTVVAGCGVGQRFRIDVPEETVDLLAQFPRPKYRVELQVLGVDENPIRTEFIARTEL